MAMSQVEDASVVLALSRMILRPGPASETPHMATTTNPSQHWASGDVCVGECSSLEAGGVV